MKKPPSLLPLSSLVLTILVIILGVFLWWRWATNPAASQDQSAQIFVIPKGQAIDTIGKRLKDAGLIRSQPAFKIIVVKNQLANKIQAGDFRLKPSMNLQDLTQQLTHGTLDIWVTLLEGWRREEMAAKIQQEFQSRGAQFEQTAFLTSTQGKEGYLFPDTYLFPREASEEVIANILETTFEAKVDLSDNQSGLSQKQVIILASIVEREVNTDKDRPLIAGILLKRFRNDWPLQADATVQYAVGTSNCSNATKDCDWWKASLTKTDIALKSPYSTYENQGLPPAPIANPSLASINAVLKPQASDYWFYISDLSGKIRYAQTIDQHNSNISKYLGK